MIPKLVHRIWFGDKPIPESYENWWRAWRRQWPSCEFATWTDRDVPRLPAVAAKIAEAEGMARKADIARYEILRQNGGIYLDCDIKPYHYRDFCNEDADLIVCQETVGEDCSIGFIAAAPGDAALTSAVDAVNAMTLNQKPTNDETGPVFWGSIVLGRPHHMLPPPAFYPYNWYEPYSAILPRDLSQTFGIHVWGASWVAEEEKKNKMVAALATGDLLETESRAGRCASGPERDEMMGIVRSIRSIRAAQMQLALSKVFSAMIGVNDKMQTFFSFDKTCPFLCEQTPSAVAWQIGAADGVTRDPLRSTLVNYDIAAVLLEPNPSIFKTLQENYAHNSNATLLNVAYGPQRGAMTLHAAVPAKMRAHNLPSWATGLSSALPGRAASAADGVDESTRMAIERCLENIDVPVIDFDQLCAASGGRLPDIVVVSTEGMDALILADIVARGARPQIIRYDKKHMSLAEIGAIDRVIEGSYIPFVFGPDVIAYRKDFLTNYCAQLYLAYGYRTIFANALRVFDGV